jgi:FkbM family methyltransferase
MPALRHRAAHFILKKLGMFNRSYREEIAGRQFVIPIINGRKTYASEEWMVEVLRGLFALRNGAFVDVGVNLGQTMLKVAAIDPARDYVGFEPNPACVDYAWKLIEANGFNYRVIPAGISSATGLLELQMFRNEDTDPSASLVPAFRPGVVRSRSVLVFRLSDLPPEIIPADVAVVKIDVEGGELFVIEGLMPLIERTRPFLVVELLPARDHERRERQERLEGHLERLNYAIFRMRSDQRGQLAGFHRIDEFGLHDDLALCDYVFAPAEEVLHLEQRFHRLIA